MVNLAYEAPVDATPLSQIEEVERQLYSRNPQRPLKRMQLDLGLVRAAPKSARIAK
jgi:hypothetical protein